MFAVRNDYVHGGELAHINNKSYFFFLHLNKLHFWYTKKYHCAARSLNPNPCQLISDSLPYRLPHPKSSFTQFKALERIPGLCLVVTLVLPSSLPGVKR